MNLNELKEARNVGEWLESRLHLMFTQIADDMFGEGRLSRDERIALSSAIGGALDAFRAGVEEKAMALYSRDPYRDQLSPSPVEMGEAGTLAPEFTELTEKAVRRDGTIPIKVIAPGWGSSGYYSPEVLKRDGPRVFEAGVQMFWDHQTATEEAERPEGSLEDLAAVLTAPARWEENGAAGPGLYADAKVFPSYIESVDSLAPHIGVSIRANGRAMAGEAEGRRGSIIQEITAAKSVDFVTKPGAGGQILQLFEAARPSHRDSAKEREMEELKEAQAENKRLAETVARLQEALLLRDAKDFVGASLAGATLPDVTKRRLSESLTSNPPIGQDGALDKTAYAARIAEAIQAETEYLQQVAGYGAGRIEGMGSANGALNTTEAETANVSKRMIESFRALGMSETEAAIAAAGRPR